LSDLASAQRGALAQSAMTDVSAPPTSSDSAEPRQASSEQRDRILATMESVVADRGYADTTVVEVITRAGISSKTFYKHFSSKEDAFRAALRVQAERVLTQTIQASKQAQDWRERVQLSLQELLRFIAESPTLARMGIVEIQLAGPEAVAEYQRWLRRYADSLAPRPGDRSSATSARAGVSDQIAGGISQLLYEQLSDDESPPLTHLLPALLEIALAPHIGPRQAAAFIADHTAMTTRA